MARSDIGSKSEPDVEASWSAETERRLVEIGAGTEELIPWEDFCSELFGESKRRGKLPSASLAATALLIPCAKHARICNVLLYSVLLSRVLDYSKSMRESSQPYAKPDELRSRIMRSNKSHGNLSTEVTLLRLLQSRGISGWRRKVAISGRPDFVFQRERVALFIDGCYWHGCKCRRLPNKNRAYWQAKFRDNQSRDRRTSRLLRASGWHVIRIWEHELKKNPQIVTNRINRILTLSRNER
jgi:DNA mismatch endonuclease, patch repair protein